MIDLDQARDLLRRAMETQGPNFVYNRSGNGKCSYSPQPDSDDPAKRITGCLIGVALAIAGEARHLEHGDVTVYELAALFPDMMSRETVLYFSTAQTSQDLGAAWGNAYSYAEITAIRITQA